MIRWFLLCFLGIRALGEAKLCTSCLRSSLSPLGPCELEVKKKRAKQKKKQKEKERKNQALSQQLSATLCISATSPPLGFMTFLCGFDVRCEVLPEDVSEEPDTRESRDETPESEDEAEEEDPVPGGRGDGGTLFFSALRQYLS